MEARARSSRRLYRPGTNPGRFAEPPLDHQLRLVPRLRACVASPQTERLFDLYKIYALTGRPGSAEASIRGPRPIDALLAQYAKKILGTEPPPVSASADEISAWRERVRDHAGALIGEIRRDDEPNRKQIARQLADLPESARIWGKNAGRCEARTAKQKACPVTFRRLSAGDAGQQDRCG